jgi:polar amino acid transport system substrate-binding protein
MVTVFNPLLANEMDPPNNKLRLAVIYIEEPPYIYQSGTSEYIGILPQLAKALSRELSLELTYLPTPRKDLEKSVIDERADMTWLSPDWVGDEKRLLFSDPVLLHREFLYSLSPFNESDEPLDWLRGKTVCIRQDYSYPSLMPFFESGVAQALRISSQVSLVKLLQKGRCDLLYMNENKATWKTSGLGIENKIWRSKHPLNEAKLSFMFSQKWQSEMPRINQALSKIKSSGELDSIVQSNTNPKL